MTGSAPANMNWIYHLDLDHVLQLNEIPPTYNSQLRKKINTLVKVVSDVEYIVAYANDHIEREYHIHVLKEEANTSSLSSIPKSAPVSATATIHVANPPPILEERDSPSVMDSSMSENSEAASLLESKKQLKNRK